MRKKCSGVRKDTTVHNSKVCLVLWPALPALPCGGLSPPAAPVQAGPPLPASRPGEGGKPLGEARWFQERTGCGDAPVEEN